MKLSEISDTVKVASVVVTIIVGATTTTWAVRANTAAVEQLTASLIDQGKRIDGLERREIQREAYAQAMRDIQNQEHDN